MPEWLKGADCKFVALCYVGSNPTRPSIYKPTIFLRIVAINDIKKNKNSNKIKRNFLILNKFLIGVIVTSIRPAKLLIKNLG